MTMFMDGLENIFDEDPIIDPEEGSSGEPVKKGDDDLFGEPTAMEPTLVDDLLKAKGISDSKIKILGEGDEEQEIDFYELSREEQLEVLNSSEQKEPSSTPDLEEKEQELIDYLRDNKISIGEYLDQYKQSIVNELETSTVDNYDIDNYDDKELFLLDLKAKYELSDEELAKELEKELQDEEMFKKKTDKLRVEYKELEDQYKEQQQTQFERERKEQYDQFSESMVDIAVNTPELHGIELEDDEKNEVLSYLLELDEEGVSNFYKELNAPAKLYEAAWFLKYGKEAFDAIRGAYESEMAKLKKDTPKVIVKDPEKKEKSIYDLNF